MNTPHVASLLLGSADPTQLRSWYVDVLGGSVDPDRFVHFGAVAILIDAREQGEAAALTLEPTRAVGGLGAEGGQVGGEMATPPVRRGSPTATSPSAGSQNAAATPPKYIECGGIGRVGSEVVPATGRSSS